MSSYRKEQTAAAEAAKLRRHGYSAGVDRILLGDGVWYRVYAGPYATREDAMKARVGILKIPDCSYAEVRRVSRH